MELMGKLLECVADLQLDAISPTEWLNKMAEIAGSEAACVTSWAVGKPEKARIEHSDNAIQVDQQWLAWADNYLRQTRPELPAFLEITARSADIDDTAGNNPFDNPNILVAFLNNDPAFTLLMFRTDTKPDGWHDDDRKRLAAILPGLMKANLLHKKITIANNRLDVANSALNGFPRAVIALSPNGEIIKPNSAGLELLEGDVFGLKGGMLTIADSRVMQQFQGKLAEIRILSAETLHQFIWNRSFRGRVDKQNFQLMLRAFPLNSFQLESSSYDRFAELVIGSLDLVVSPTTDQLRDFYDLSNAQARVVVALMQGDDLATSAEKLCISINTIRSHVRAIYDKLGVDNQRDLQRLLSSTLVNYSNQK